MVYPENNELSLWKVGEQLVYSQCKILGEKLGIQPTKIENIHAKVQRGICTQEEMNFEVLHEWMANQTPDDNPVAHLQDILVEDLNFSWDKVQATFKQEHFLYKSATKRSLGQLQLLKIAEKVNTGLHIPLILRLGLTFTELQASRQKYGGDPVQSLFVMLCMWQKDLSADVDQFQSMCKILEVCKQRGLAYHIRKNTWGVENKSGKKIMLCELQESIANDEFLSSEDLRINPSTAARIESLLKFIADIFEQIPGQLDLIDSKLGEMYDECRSTSKVLSNIQEAVGIQHKYELSGFTMSSFFLHVRVLSKAGLARLREDMNNGSIASRLEKVLDTYEASEILSQMKLAREKTAQPAKPIVHVSGQRSGVENPAIHIWEPDSVRTTVTTKEARKARAIRNDKVFNDPIHSSIPVPPYCQLIIDTPEFQRLRFIKQLGCTCYVFPSAVHTRFEHSIGVSHFAGKLANMLLQRNDRNKTDIQKNEVICVEIAGLCHDLGYGPFFDAFDDLIPPNRDGTKWTHKQQSVKIFKYLIKKNKLERQLADYSILKSEIDFICELILGGPREKDAELLRENKFYLYQIVNNSANKVDVKKWDYFARDTLYLGMKSAFDFNRIVPFVKVLDVERDGEIRKELCFRDKVANDLNHMFLTRRRLHYAAYNHRVTKIISIMLKDAFRAATDHLQFVGQDGTKYNLLESVEDPMAFCQVNDTIVNEIMRSESEEPGMVKAREIVERIHNRQLYQCIGTYQHASGEPIHGTLDSAKITQELVNKNDDLWQAGNIQVDVSYFDYGDNDKNPLLKIAFYDKSEEKSKFLSEDQLPVDQPRSLQDTRVSIYYTKLPVLNETDLKDAKSEGNDKLKRLIIEMARDPNRQRKRTISAPPMSYSGELSKKKKTNEKKEGETIQELKKSYSEGDKALLKSPRGRPSVASGLPTVIIKPLEKPSSGSDEMPDSTLHPSEQIENK